MNLNMPESINYTSLDQQLVHLGVIVEQIQNYFQQSRPAVVPSSIYEGVSKLSLSLPQLRRQVNSLEEERRNLQALAQIGQVVNSSLELDSVLKIVMDTIIRITAAERGFLMLANEEGELTIRVARNFEQESIDPTEIALSRTIIYRVAKDGQSVLTTNAQEDPRFTGQQSVVAYNLRSILCVPLKFKDEITGVVYADNRVRSGLFTQKELDLLNAFANQAAVAIENARLFDSVRHTLAEVTELKNLMENVFASIASGVITADVQERILMCNRAAEVMLGRAAHDIVGSNLNLIFPPLISMLEPYLMKVLKTDQPILGLEASQDLPERGRVDLRFSLSPLKDIRHDTQGVAIVMEDLTDKKRLEAQHRLFEKMVSPAVISQLDADTVELGGKRGEITILFADIRGFTEFSESVQPEELVAVLNRYLASAADCVLSEAGTIDKFLGDAVMSWFNAPVLQADHTLRAVRAALAIQDSVQRLHKRMPPVYHLSFGIGIHVGDAILGMVGTEKRMEYTAIGDSVNTGKRIQENASEGQILISQEAYLHVADSVIVKSVNAIQAKGKRIPIQVYQVLGLKS